MTPQQSGAILAAVFIWALAFGAVAPTLAESWRLGGPGARVAAETIYAQVSR